MSVRLQSQHECPGCKVQHSFAVNATNEEILAMAGKYSRGALIQDAFPILTNEQREIMLTGTCNDAWDQLFKE